MKTVYLAGPILGNTKTEAKTWRKGIIDVLAVSNIRGISPLRCEPLIGERYGTGTPDPKFGTARAIASKNFYDVSACDMTLAFFPKDLTDRDGISIGTVIEVAHAHALNKPTIIVSRHPKVLAHPVLDACAGWKLEYLDEAVDVIEGILGDYATPTWRKS